MCLSVFPHDVSKTDVNLTYKCSMMNPGNLCIFGSKVEGQGHDSQNTSLCRSSIFPLAAYVSTWVFTAAMSRRASHDSDTGFSLRPFSATDAAAARRFFRAWSFFAVIQRQKHCWRGSWHSFETWVLASSSSEVFLAETSCGREPLLWLEQAFAGQMLFRSSNYGVRSLRGTRSTVV